MGSVFGWSTRVAGIVGASAVTVSAGEIVLVGRDAECGRVAELLERARSGRSGAVVLSGEAGIGKSALCRWAVAQAADMQVISVHGVESELDLPFAALSELLTGVVDRIAELPAPQARALDVALARREAADGDRFSIGAAVLGLFGLVGEGGPVLVVIDDAQWLDGASADALLFAARRLHREGVALLAATRPGALFDAQATGLAQVPVHGLHAGAALALLGAAHGALPDAVAGVLAERTHGNPLALLEVPLVLDDAQLAGEAPIEDPLPVGPALVRALVHRLEGLSQQERQALLLAAASGGERVQPVLDALATLGLDHGVLDAAEQSGVLALDRERFAFCHPLLRSAIYHAASGPARRAAHAALARVTSGEPHVWHLAEATLGEDETVAALLERCGLEARRRGAPQAAASTLERAARLTAPGADRVRRLTEAARDAHIAGRATRASRLLAEALADVRDPVQRADIQHARGRMLVLHGQRTVGYRLLVDEAQRVRELDPGRAATMLTEACLDGFIGADVPSALAAARDACELAGRAGGPVQAFATSMLASVLILGGEGARAAPLLDPLLPLLRVADPLTEAGLLVALAAQSLLWLERHDDAAELLDRLIASARAASAPAALLLPLPCRGDLDLRIGRWSVADAELEEAVCLAQETDQAVHAAYALECRAQLAAATGDEDRCREYAARALRLIDEHHNELGRLYVHSALGLLELGLGHMQPAIGHLEQARQLATRGGLADPNVVRWQADLVEAYARTGDLEAARDALAELERQAQHTRGRWALGAAARSRGLLAADDQFDSCFAAALDHLQAVSAPFELARAQLCHGERLRRAGRRAVARNALRAAIEGFEALRAAPWATRARTELRATGMAPRRRRDDPERDELTPHELQVARIVAGGATNREAAAALFVTSKTIEFHLARIYRKLGVNTRTQLAALAARRGWLEHPQQLAAGATN